MFNKLANNDDAKAIANEAKMKAAPKGRFIATFVGMSFKPATQESAGGLSFSFKSKDWAKPFWANVNPTDRGNWAGFDKSGTIFDARKKNVLNRTVAFVEILYYIGCLTQLSEGDELLEGDTLGDWVYGVPLRELIGKTAVIINCSDEGFQNWNKSPSVDFRPEDPTQLMMNGGREFKIMLASIPQDCISWIITQLINSNLTNLATGQYRMRIESMKEYEGDGKEELRFILTSWNLDKQLETDGRRTYVKLNMQREGDVQFAQALQQIIGTDETMVVGKYFDAMMILGESSASGREFKWNYFSDVYEVDSTIVREGLPVGTYRAPTPKTPKPATVRLAETKQASDVAETVPETTEAIVEVEDVLLDDQEDIFAE